MSKKSENEMMEAIARMEKQEKLLNAIDAGDTEAVRALIKKRVDLINREDHFFYFPLHQAVLEGHTEICSLLISAGAEVNGRKSGYTPLHYAAARGKPEICLMLLAAGAYINALSNNDDTPLHLAAKGGCGVTCSLLIEAGAKKNAIGEMGYTPLHWAAHLDNVEACSVLIDAGADIHAKDPHDENARTPMDLAKGETEGLFMAVEERMRLAAEAQTPKASMGRRRI